MAAGTHVFGDVFEVDASTEVFGLVWLIGADPVGGPFCIDRVEIYVAGADEAIPYSAGSDKTAPYTAGFDELETC